MLPSYPASTFPNHYTLATGLVPDHNGYYQQHFLGCKTSSPYSMGDPATRNNPDYYLGEPIWITAQKQGVKTGNVYWVGSDIAIKGGYPTYYREYAEKPRLTLNSGWIRPSLFWKSRKRNVPVSLCFTLKSRMV